MTLEFEEICATNFLFFKPIAVVAAVSTQCRFSINLITKNLNSINVTTESELTNDRKHLKLGGRG